MKALNLPLADAEVNYFEDHCLSFSMFEQLAGVLPLDGEILGKYLAIPKCTLSRVAGAGHFSVSESRNLAALIRVLIAANELFEGDVQAAKLFLSSQ